MALFEDPIANLPSLLQDYSDDLALVGRRQGPLRVTSTYPDRATEELPRCRRCPTRSVTCLHS